MKTLNKKIINASNGLIANRKLQTANCLLIFSLFLLPFANLLAQPGSLDNTFGTNGRIDIPIGTSEDYGKAVAVQPNGKIVVAGYFRTPAVAFTPSRTDIYVMRVNADGTPDNSFDNDGILIIPTGDIGSKCHAMALQPDGKILLGGVVVNTGGFWHFLVIRLNADGTPDTGFGVNGQAVIPIGPNGDAEAKAIAVGSDGKIVVAGSSSPEIGTYDYTGFAVVCLLSDGTLDGSFDGDGVRVIKLPPGGNQPSAVAESVVIQADGKIVLAGTSKDTYNAPEVATVLRLNADGSNDTGFNGTGMGFFVSPGTTVGRFYSVVLQPDNKILLTGMTASTPYAFIKVMRLDTDGTPDINFSGDGDLLVQPSSTSSSFGICMAVQPDGKILVAGSNSSTFNTFIVIRLESSGSFDFSFDSDGIALPPAISSYSERVNGIALQSDAKIVLAGSNGQYVFSDQGGIEVIVMRLNGSSCTGQDLDSDTYTDCEGDCDDNDGSVNPGATELCNGIDDNCDGQIDELCDLDNDGYTTAQGDCNDADSTINPGATEVCNGIDDDCNTLIDDGLVFQNYYIDYDGDGYGGALLGSFCAPPSGSAVTVSGDCNDINNTIHPNAIEICNGIDDDCLNGIDDGLPLLIYYADADGDTYGDAAVSQSFCTLPLAGWVLNNTDCNDNPVGGAAINPGATEVCNGYDDDCDGLTDDADASVTGQPTWYEDADGDGHGNPAVTLVQCMQPVNYVSNSGDCNDGNNLIHPGAAEICNGIDDDCNSLVDEGSGPVYYRDFDNDGYGDAAVTQVFCNPPVSGWVFNSTDCNDFINAINPGAIEICNGIDDDCNNLVDDGLVFIDYYADVDADTYGGAFLGNLCSAPANSVTIGGDCDDGNNAINPGAAEICNSIDDDCNNLVDDGLVFIDYYADVDADTYGGAFLGNLCSAPANSVTIGGDCNDANNAIHPGVAEVCNGIDDDCNLLVDDGLIFLNYYADLDGDLYGGALLGNFCSAPAGSVTVGGDCNDNPVGGAAINPAAIEICNGIDDNCSGQIDEGVLLTFFRDADGDTYGTVALTTQACSAPAGYVSNSGDCNDGNNAIHPGVPDVCDGIDNNCNSQVDENGITATVTPAGNTNFCNNTFITLTANAGAGISYQWFRNNTAIAGATAQTYTTSIAGKYKVSESNSAGCTSSSAFTTVKKIHCREGIPDEASSQETDIAVYPNPFAAEFTVAGAEANGELILFDMLGKEILRIKTLDTETKINTENLLPGIYFLNYTQENKTGNIKLMKF